MSGESVGWKRARRVGLFNRTSPLVSENAVVLLNIYHRLTGLCQLWVESFLLQDPAIYVVSHLILAPQHICRRGRPLNFTSYGRVLLWSEHEIEHPHNGTLPMQSAAEAPAQSSNFGIFGPWFAGNVSSPTRSDALAEERLRPFLFSTTPRPNLTRAAAGQKNPTCSTA